jgi:TetR/AcrR family transcriptional regulator, regulator of cefoperazone and chloramphenicol sensitivity
MSTRVDQETRRRVLEAAAQLFAERGYQNVTIRDICAAADANVAAVNYYFHDKLGLYKAVIEMVADAMDRAKRDALETGEGRSAEDRLRTYISGFLSRVFEKDKKTSCIEGLIGREMAEPSPAFELIVKRGIIPHSQRLGDVIAELAGIPADDPRIRFCNASIQAQCLFYRSAEPVMRYMIPDLKITPQFIEKIAQQISDFSLAGIRALAQQPVEVKR